MIRRLGLPLLLVLTSGCGGTHRISESLRPDDPVAAAARALSEGEAASQAGPAEAARLAVSVDRLVRLDARPLDATTADRVRDWETLLGPERQRTVYRGRVLGPAYRRGAVSPRGQTATEQTFLAGQMATLAVAPSPGARLVLTVEDSKGSKTCQRTVREPMAGCRWVPLFSERYRIRIENPGREPASYYLVVN